VVIALIYLFVAAFAMTWAVVLRVFCTEIQPSRTRATASSLALSANWFVNLGVALSTPVFLARSPSGPYFMFGGCLVITSVVCLIWMPETLGKSLQEVDEVWENSVRRSKAILGRHRRLSSAAEGNENIEMQPTTTRQTVEHV